MLTGVGQGLAGLFLKPAQGIQRNGLKGCVLGCYQGLAGLILKPVTGLFDAVSKTGQGVKNTLNYFDHKPNQARQRHPRVFYGQEAFFKPFHYHDSQIVSLLNHFNKALYSHSSYLGSVNFSNSNKIYYLVILMDYILLFNFTNQKLLWAIQTKYISNILFDHIISI